jgi:hypothetical protein
VNDAGGGRAVGHHQRAGAVQRIGAGVAADVGDMAAGIAHRMLHAPQCEGVALHLLAGRRVVEHAAEGSSPTTHSTSGAVGVAKDAAGHST